MGLNPQTRCAIYARVSTDKQSCDRQLADLRAFAELKGLVVAGEYSDIVSGAATIKRNRARLIKDIPRLKISAILITELSRFGRSLRDLIETLDLLETNQVSLIPINGLAFDWSAPMGKLLVSILGAMGEFERALIEERVRSGLDHARAKGIPLGRRAKGDPEWKDIDNSIRDLRAAGATIDEISAAVSLSKSSIYRRIKALDQKSSLE